MQQKADRTGDASEKQRACSPCRGSQLGGSLTCRSTRLKQQQRDRGDDRGTRQVKQSFERVNSKQVRDRKLFLPREQQRPYRLSRASEKKDSREARQRHGVNRTETRRTKIVLENLPPQGAKSVTGVNRDNRKDQQPGIGVADGPKKFCAAKIGKANHS